ncbi:MAG: hypothetical protein K2J39_08375 [Ruminococcus sp.]|nr:hypothetical protein [Ruminococcus sp.]
MKNILAKIFIITGYILQLLYSYVILAVCGTLAFGKWGAYESFDAVKLSLEISDIFNIVIVTLIFVVFAFLPYGLTKCFYWWYYEERKISECWIIPSKMISIIAVSVYIIGSILYFLNI